MSSLGDVIHALPALSDAAAAHPAVRFDWVVEEAFQEIPAWHPAVERVIPVAIRRWRKQPLRDFSGPEWRQARNALGQRQYDAVIDAQGLIKSALISRLAKGPRYGMDKHSVRERAASWAYQHKIAVPSTLHAVERIRLLFARALAYAPPGGPGDYGVREQLPGNTARLPPGLLFFHGTARAEKLWPEKYWVELAVLAVARGLRVWLPWGSVAERQRAERIAAAVAPAAVQLAQQPAVQVLPRQSLAQIAEMLLAVRAVVALDTGLGHLAAALDVPSVSLYGPTRPDLIGAYGRNQSHLQAGAAIAAGAQASESMAAIEPGAVWQALQADLGAVAPAQGA